jgi:hypothetical protein
MNNWLQWVIQTATVILLGIVGYFLKDMKKTHEEKIAENKEDIKALRKDFDTFKDEAPMRYVYRDDFIRTITGVDKQFENVDTKLDKIYDILANPTKKGCE